MFGHNTAFIGDPFGYVQSKPLNNLNLEPQSGHGMGQQAMRNALAAMENQKHGFFDLEHQKIGTINNTRLRAVVGSSFGSRPGMESWIQAYYVGYQMPGIQGAGTANIPFVDLPRTNPAYDFMFTGAMNGCSLVVTATANPNTIRVWHDSVHGATTFAGETVLLRLDYDASEQRSDVTGLHTTLHTYSDPGGGLANAFDFMYYDRGAGYWWLVSQPQLILPVHLATQAMTYSAPPVQINGANPPFRVPVPP